MPTSFAVGVSVFYVGLALCLVEVVLEPFFRTRPPWIQIVLIAIIGVAFDWFTIGIVLSSARLDVDAHAINVPHFNGDTFGGIRWNGRLLLFRS